MLTTYGGKLTLTETCSIGEKSIILSFYWPIITKEPRYNTFQEERNYPLCRDMYGLILFSLYKYTALTFFFHFNSNKFSYPLLKLHYIRRSTNRIKRKIKPSFTLGLNYIKRTVFQEMNLFVSCIEGDFI